VSPAGPTVSILIVTWNERTHLAQCLPPLLEQLRDGDELIVADNASTDGTADEAERLAPGATVIRMASNEGYMPACNAAAERARGDLLLTLDADATVGHGFLDAIRAPATNGCGWDAWMGVVTMEDGRLINTSGGMCHFTGISWAHQVGEPIESAPAGPEEVAFVTGVCLTTTRAAWERSPGFPPEFFLYFDDVDYSWRVRLTGGRLGVQPAARIDHLYDFNRSRPKWRMLERNRWAALIRVYPAELLALLAPALVATELALLVVALKDGWLREKLQATRDVLVWLPRLLRERRQIQAQRAVTAAEFARTLTADLTSPYFGRAGRSRVLRLLLRAYWRGVRAVL
jgi:GT2 family glycosyltransferase